MKPSKPRATWQALCTSGLLLSATSLCHAQTAAPNVQDLIRQGEIHDVSLNAPQALALYSQAEKVQPNDPDLMVKIARQYRHLMADASSKSEKLRLGRLALDYGNRAAAAGPKNSDAQLSPAISYGKMLTLLDSGEQVRCSKVIKLQAEKAIKLNPRNDLAWHILGRWHRNVASISGVKRTLASIVYEKLPDGSHKESVTCLEKAIEINPNRVIHYIELGRTHAIMGNTAEARRYLAHGLKMPSKEKDDEEAKVAGRETLASL